MNIDKTFLSELAIVFMLCGFFFTSVEKETLSIVSNALATLTVFVLGSELQKEENNKNKL